MIGLVFEITSFSDSLIKLKQSKQTRVGSFFGILFSFALGAMAFVTIHKVLAPFLLGLGIFLCLVSMIGLFMSVHIVIDKNQGFIRYERGLPFPKRAEAKLTADCVREVSVQYWPGRGKSRTYYVLVRFKDLVPPTVEILGSEVFIAPEGAEKIAEKLRVFFQRI